VPEDLQRELESNEQARRFFSELRACGRGGARGYKALQVVSFSVAEYDGIFLLHNEASVPTVSSCNQIKRNGVLEPRTREVRRIHILRG
jgi:hypothetical protein